MGNPYLHVTVSNFKDTHWSKKGKWSLEIALLSKININWNCRFFVSLNTMQAHNLEATFINDDDVGVHTTLF